MLKNMPFFYILYILIKKILKILYWGRNLQGRTGKGPKPLGAEPEKGRNLWHSICKRTWSYLNISCNTSSIHCGIFPFLWKCEVNDFESVITCPQLWQSSFIICIQKFTFWDQEDGFRFLSLNGENRTDILVSSSQILATSRSMAPWIPRK